MQSQHKKRTSIHLSVLLFTSLSSTVAESNPFFLFSLSDLLVPSFPRSLISVPPFTLLSLPVTSHIKPFCTLLFVPLFNARAPLFLQSFSHNTLKALIPLCNILWRKHFLQQWLCFTFSCCVFDILKQRFVSTNSLEQLFFRTQILRYTSGDDTMQKITIFNFYYYYFNLLTLKLFYTKNKSIFF